MDLNDLRDTFRGSSDHLIHALLIENNPLSKKNPSIASLTSTVKSSVGNRGGHRRRSEDDGGIDFFLTQKDMRLDVLEWEDIRNTRLGRRLNMQMSKKDRDLAELREKVRQLDERYRNQAKSSLVEADTKVH